MAACTSRAALLMSRSRSNIKEMRVEPSVLRELISLRPAIDPSDCSSGVATLDAMVSGLAPASLAETDIMGKRSAEHTSELQSLMRILYDVFCLHNKTTTNIKSKRQIYL